VTELAETENGEFSLPNFRVLLILGEAWNRNRIHELKNKINFSWEILDVELAM
jgi:hypothetical protein